MKQDEERTNTDSTDTYNTFEDDVIGYEIETTDVQTDFDDWDDEDTDEDDGLLHEHYAATAPAGQSLMRVDKFLMEHLAGVSRARIQAAAKADCLRVDGRPVKSSYRIKPGERAAIVMRRPKYENKIIPQDLPIEVTYEDSDVILINKAPGMVVHPGCGNYTGTLVNALAWHLKDDPRYDPDSPETGLVHRIDKDTSGLILAAKTPQAKTCLAAQFFYFITRRKYNALVWGSFDSETGRIEGNIARHPKDRMQMAVFPPDSEIGKPAVTHYRVLEQFGPVTLVECRLETGRTHQIRAHMKHIGHPLFGDERYGGTEILRGQPTAHYRQFVRRCLEICPRQALHARTLGFRHPTTGEEMDFESPLPEDMILLLERWRRYALGNGQTEQE